MHRAAHTALLALRSERMPRSRLIVGGAVAPKTFEQLLREPRAAQRHLSELGVTTTHDITPPTQLPVCIDLRRRGELTVRVFARLALDKWDELRYAGIAPGFGDDWVRVRALKGFVDGIQGNSTARSYEPQLHSGKRGEWRDSTNTAATGGRGSGMELADFVVVDRDLFAIPATQLKDAKVLMTVVGGRIVHAAAPFTR